MTIIELIEAVAAGRVHYVEAIQHLMAMRIDYYRKANAARYLRAAFARSNRERNPK